MPFKAIFTGQGPHKDITRTYLLVKSLRCSYTMGWLYPSKTQTKYTHTQCSAFESPIPAESGSYRSLNTSLRMNVSLRKQVTGRQSQGQQPFSDILHIEGRISTSWFGSQISPSLDDTHIHLYQFQVTEAPELSGIKLVLLFV